MIRYFLLVNLYSGFLYVLYLVLLKNRSQHTWSRYYLLLTCVLALVLPFIQPALHIWQQEGQQAAGIVLPELIVGAGNTFLRSAPDRTWFFWIYGGTVLLLLTRLAIRLIRLRRFLSGLQFKQEGACHIATNTGFGPASFGRKIIFPEARIDPMILQHEQAHLHYRHYYDKTGMALLQCICFPVLAFYLIGRELEAVHEFEADARAAARPDLYARTLLSAHLGVQQLPLLQSFFQHPLKRRIMMLQQQKTSDKNRHRILLALTTLTITGILFFQSAGPAIARQSETSKTSHERSATPAEQASGNTGSAVAQQKEAGRYEHEDNTMAEQPVEAADPAPQQHNSKTDHDKIFTSVENLPEFPGGQNAMMQFMAQNIRYPESARKSNLQGRVYAQFVVNKEGKIENIVIQKSLSRDCDQEVIRVIRAMPDWKPGKQNGEAVNVYYTLPVSFRLQK